MPPHSQPLDARARENPYPCQCLEERLAAVSKDTRALLRNYIRCCAFMPPASGGACAEGEPQGGGEEGVGGGVIRERRTMTDHCHEFGRRLFVKLMNALQATPPSALALAGSVRRGEWLRRLG